MLSVCLRRLDIVASCVPVCISVLFNFNRRPFRLNTNIIQIHSAVGSVRSALHREMPPGKVYEIPMATRGTASLEIRRGVFWGQKLQGRGQGKDVQGSLGNKVLTACPSLFSLVPLLGLI